MFKTVYPSGVLALALVACGSPQGSQTKGHYEEASADAVSKYEGQQQVPAEYAPSQGVIVSLPLISDFGREDIVESILKAGVSKVWIVVNKNSRESLQSSTFTRLRQRLSGDMSRLELLPQKDDGGVTVWARDWSPLGAVDSAGKLRLLDLNYYPRRPADDATGRAFAALKGVSRVSVPVYNEGGNFMANEKGDCLMTTRVTDANNDVFMTGDLVLDAQDITGYYQNFAGCRSVHIFQRMPNERTGHIDMWAKFLDSNTVIVNQISNETLSFAGSDRQFGESIQNFLEDRAAEIADLGYKVVRVPMPLPRMGLFRSYTNSLLVNGHAIIPRYSSNYADGQLVAQYEASVQGVYSSSGYTTSFIPSDELIANGGAVHCVTMQVPAGR